MIIWAISIKTVAQHNTYCVDDKAKIEPYIDECMKNLKKSNKYLTNRYKIKWLAIDFAIIYKVIKGKPYTNDKHGEIHRYCVH